MAIERINDTLYNVLDQYTGEEVTYNKVTTYSDGTAMNDGKCDGVIYRKFGTEYFKRSFTGAISVKWFGAKGDGITNDTVAIQKAINTGQKELYFEEGNYLCTLQLFLNKSSITYNGSQNEKKNKNGKKN